MMQSLFIIWQEISAWCSSPTHERYAEYGGCGITLADAWQDFTIFATWALCHGYYEGAFLLRENPGGPFSPENCRWVAVQTRRKRRLFTFWGESKSLTAWGRDPRVSVCARTIWERLAAGWDVEKAFMTPRQQSGPPRIILTAFGESKPQTEWLRDPRCVVQLGTLVDRLRHGWDTQTALSTPASLTNRLRIAKAASIPLGTTFGRLTVISPPHHMHRNKKPFYSYTCRCACGTEHRVAAHNLLNGSVISCGCYLREIIQQQQRRYPKGTTGSPLYTLWRRIRKGCSDPTASHYARFGGIGIHLHPSWHDDFLVFQTWALSQGYQPGMRLARRNPEGDFTPENCYIADWHTWLAQEKGSQLLTAFGETQLILAWLADPRCGVERSTLRHRLAIGWPPERALTEPPRWSPRSRKTP
ncbi:MAG: hypothetical protein ACYC7E_12150 [Armatimonadota bacterium]